LSFSVPQEHGDKWGLEIEIIPGIRVPVPVPQVSKMMVCWNGFSCAGERILHKEFGCMVVQGHDDLGVRKCLRVFSILKPGCEEECGFGITNKD
jgi:hypothetical protein